MTNDATRRRLQALETAHNHLLHSIAHDMRAPVRHVTSYVPLIREALQTDPPQMAEALDLLTTLAQSAQHMGRMLEGLQTLTHITRVPLHLQAVALNTAIDAARADIPCLKCRYAPLPHKWEREAESPSPTCGRGVGERVEHRTRASPKVEAGSAPIQWHIAPDLPSVWADRTLLHQLLVQVLDNACKFTRYRSQPVIHIHTAPSSIADCACIRIQDNGAGFDSTRAHNLFGLFQRMHRAADFDGAGVGLALCQTIARRHDAHIYLESAPDKGCTVLIDWPLPPAPANQALLPLRKR